MKTEALKTKSYARLTAEEHQEMFLNTLYRYIEVADEVLNILKNFSAQECKEAIQKARARDKDMASFANAAKQRYRKKRCKQLIEAIQKYGLDYKSFVNAVLRRLDMNRYNRANGDMQSNLILTALEDLIDSPPSRVIPLITYQSKLPESLENRQLEA